MVSLYILKFLAVRPEIFQKIFFFFQRQSCSVRYRLPASGCGHFRRGGTIREWTESVGGEEVDSGAAALGYEQRVELRWVVIVVLNVEFASSWLVYLCTPCCKVPMWYHTTFPEYTSSIHSAFASVQETLSGNFPSFSVSHGPANSEAFRLHELFGPLQERRKKEAIGGQIMDR